MGKSKSWFDLNHDSITGDDLIWVQKIWFGNMWFGFDFILCDLIWWFEQITTFSNLGHMSIPASSAAVERLFSTGGALIRARRARLTAKTVESLLFRMEGQRLWSRELLWFDLICDLGSSDLDLIWFCVILFVIWHNDLNLFCQMICDLGLRFDLWFAHHCHIVCYA